VSFASEGGGGSFFDNLDRPWTDMMMAHDALVDYHNRMRQKP
jgi:hypothetical protein